MTTVLERYQKHNKLPAQAAAILVLAEIMEEILEALTDPDEGVSLASAADIRSSLDKAREQMDFANQQIGKTPRLEL
jgi:hypothetical protein